MPDCGCNHFPVSLGNVTFDASVGIGAATPGAPLHVAYNDPGASLLAKLENINTGQVRIMFTRNGHAGTGLGRGSALWHHSNMFGIANYEAMPVTFWTGATVGSASERVRVDASGKVGIGTPTPGEMLDVAGNIKLSGSVFAGSRKVADVGGCYYAD